MLALCVVNTDCFLTLTTKILFEVFWFLTFVIVSVYNSIVSTIQDQYDKLIVPHSSACSSYIQENLHCTTMSFSFKSPAHTHTYTYTHTHKHNCLNTAIHLQFQAQQSNINHVGEENKTFSCMLDD